jgi:hypothetical protein
MLRARDHVGRTITRDEEASLLEACRSSRSRSLYRAVLLGAQYLHALLQSSTAPMELNSGVPLSVATRSSLQSWDEALRRRYECQDGMATSDRLRSDRLLTH